MLENKKTEHMFWKCIDFLQCKKYNMFIGGVRQFGAKYITGGNPVW